MTHQTPPHVPLTRRVTTGRTGLATRVAIVLAVLATTLGVAGYVASASPAFSLETPRSGAPVSPGEEIPVGGEAGGVPQDALFLVTGEPATGDGELFTLATRPTVDEADGRWSGAVVAPEVERGTAARLVAVRADPACGSSLAEMAADPEAGGRFFGPLPPGCVELASAPLPVSQG